MSPYRKLRCPPTIGDELIWEPRRPDVSSWVTVVQFSDDGEMVKLRDEQGRGLWNDLSRVMEACMRPSWLSRLGYRLFDALCRLSSRLNPP